MDYQVTNPVSREIAKAALDEGKKISHQYFADGEYVKKVDGKLVDETGIVLDSKTFWDIRSTDNWKNDWFILN